MARYDRVFIDPEPSDLDQSLQQAVAAANERRRQRRVEWPLEGRDDLQRALTQPHGYRQWNGGDGPARPTEARAIVALAWWTDRVGRKHHRLVGRQGLFNRPMLDNLLCPFGDPRPPLWFVYPHHVFVQRAGDDRVALAVCACGAYGPPEQLGWMGRCCDACFDLGVEGGCPTPAWLDPDHATLHCEEGRMQFLAFAPDGRTLAAGTGREHVTLWDTTTGLERGRLVGSEDDWLLGVGWLDDGQRLVTADAHGRLRFWSGRTGLPVGGVVEVGASECFAVSPDGAMVGRGSRTGAHLHTGEGLPGRELQDPLPEASVLCFSPAGELVAAGNRHGAVGVWDTATGKARGRLDRPGALVTGLAFSQDGAALAVALHPALGSSAAEAQRVLLWDVEADRVQGSFPGHPGGTRCVAFAPDGRIVVTGGEDGLIRLWDRQTGAERVALEWHLDCVASVALAPDGLALASGSFDGTIKLWPREVLRPVSRTRQRSPVGSGR